MTPTKLKYESPCTKCPKNVKGDDMCSFKCQEFRKWFSFYWRSFRKRLQK